MMEMRVEKRVSDLYAYQLVTALIYIVAIEDRVARIKARVAQLTGGIDRPAAQA